MLATKSFIATHLPTGEKNTSPQYCYCINEEFIRYYVVLGKLLFGWLECFVLALTLNFEVGKIAKMQLPEK